jgi:hypothetical protein
MDEGSNRIVLSSSRGSKAVSIDQTAAFDIAADPSLQDVVTVAASGWVAIPIGSITGGIGKLAVINLDATNYIETAVDAAGTYKFGRIDPGEFQLWQPPAAVTTIYWKANSADCSVKYAAVSKKT